MTYRNTPKLTIGEMEECHALNCVQVPLEILEKVLAGQCALEGSGDNHLNRLCELEIMEDYNHAYVKDSTYFVSKAYLTHHGITI